MIRGIIFDCFGVLYHGSIGHLYELTPKESRKELENLSLSSDYGYVSRQEFLVQASELIGKDVDELQSIMQSDHIRNAQLVEHVKSLRSHYKIAMLSNVGRGVVDRLFSKDELAELFDVVILSSEVGMVKPDPDIFRLASDRLGLLAEECMMVDDLEANIVSAKTIGMQGIVFSTTDGFISAMNEFPSR
jgi:epoxide hydrolase-like predicted phosphatase